MRTFRIEHGWTACVFIVLGLILLLWPAQSVDIVVRITAVGLLAAAAVGILVCVRSRAIDKPYRIFKICQYALCAALGVWALADPRLFEDIYQIIIGAMIALNAVMEIVVVVRNCRHWIYLALAILGLVLGVVVMCDPFSIFRAFAVMAGLSLLYSGAVLLIDGIRNGRSY